LESEISKWEANDSMCSLWCLDVKSNTRIKQTQTYTASDDPPSNETERNGNMQKLAAIHQIETAEALVF
jgi:hypothetical protein